MSPIPAYGDLLGPGRSQQRVAFLPMDTLLGPGRSQLVGTLWVLEGHSMSPIPAYGDLLGPGRSQQRIAFLPIGTLWVLEGHSNALLSCL